MTHERLLLLAYLYITKVCLLQFLLQVHHVCFSTRISKHTKKVKNSVQTLPTSILARVRYGRNVGIIRRVTFKKTIINMLRALMKKRKRQTACTNMDNVRDGKPRKNHIETLESKSSLKGMKNIFDGLISRLNVAEGKKGYL